MSKNSPRVAYIDVKIQMNKNYKKKKRCLSDDPCIVFLCSNKNKKEQVMGSEQKCKKHPEES